MHQGASFSSGSVSDQVILHSPISDSYWMWFVRRQVPRQIKNENADANLHLSYRLAWTNIYHQSAAKSAQKYALP